MPSPATVADQSRDRSARGPRGAPRPVNREYTRHDGDVATAKKLRGDLLLADMGQGVPFRAASFDGAISISALQWICNIDKSVHKFRKRLHTFFDSLFACLSNGARAVFQFYPENEDQISIITESAMQAGFSGGTVVDYPNSKKAKKFYLVLISSCGGIRQGSGVANARERNSSNSQW
ncbi:hypothetical protein QAD02_012578 [Eretmocerus hayati]|uniref:Uncharacterized protein n=1 Tax=Eretmocerus hayati TaxID=131215 RepID=A0ACC2P039_9HYME|nr:hypothetical protein QAD02_012578 [Eretmocerus hayati]